MRKAISILAVASLMLLMGALSEAIAAQSGQITITVSVSPNLSVELSGNSVALGTVAVGSTTVSSQPVVVKNNGSGIAEVYTLSHSTLGDWTSGTTPGVETFVLNAAFADSVAGASWAHINSVVSDSVPYDGTRKLWFQFKAPTSTATANEQSIAVTVTAQLP